MNTARIAELLKPFLNPATTPNHCHSEPGQRPGEGPAVLPSNDQRLTTNDLERISTYIDILIRWNARINLTAIRDPEDIVTRHFGESLFAARHLFPVPPTVPSVVKDFDFDLANDQRPTTNDRIADIGSGAGFPGLPIKIWSPHVSLTLIESNHKKAAFLGEVVRSLTLTNVNIQNARAEFLIKSTTRSPTGSPTEMFDVVTLRAVEHFDTILPTAAALLAPSGRLALLIGAAQQDQALSLLPDLAWSAPAPIPQSRSRILLVATRSHQAATVEQHK